MPLPFPIPPSELPLLIVDFFISALIVACCFSIYVNTREFYRLTKHEGIKYFRYAFLFFAISFLGQWLFPLARIFHVMPQPFMFFVSVYAGSVAVLALLYSVFWKRLQKRIVDPLLVMNVGGLLIAFSASFFRHPLYIIVIQGIALCVAAIASYLQSRRQTARSGGVHVLYLLLFLSWIANAIANVAMRESILVAVAFNALALVLFSIIFAKVLKMTARK